MSSFLLEHFTFLINLHLHNLRKLKENAPQDGTFALFIRADSPSQDIISDITEDYKLLA